MILHDALHGFRSGRGTGGDTLEANLAQQLKGISHKPLLQVFLGFRKAYDFLDRGWSMDIMRGYGMVHKIDGLINHR